MYSKILPQGIAWVKLIRCCRLHSIHACMGLRILPKTFLKFTTSCLVTHLDCSLFGLNVREKSLWVVINLLKLVRSGRKLVMKFSQYYQNAKKNIYVWNTGQWLCKEKNTLLILIVNIETKSMIKKAKLALKFQETFRGCVKWVGYDVHRLKQLPLSSSWVLSLA